MHAKQVFALLDLTSLNPTDNATTIAALCEKAITPDAHVAALCVYPQFIPQVKMFLAAKKNAAVKIATVANFPAGTDSITDVISSLQQAIKQGADEIDVVFPYPLFLQGDKTTPYDFIRACKATCGEKILLKVILETGALPDLNTVAEISYNVAHAGADFLKTSTGKIAVGATKEAVQVMLDSIKKIPRAIGLKVAGGVRTLEDALAYVALASRSMGAAWVTPQHFRLGASSLVDNMFLDG